MFGWESDHEVLGLSADAGVEEIREAYRRLVKEYHPDVSRDPAAAEHFLRIGTADRVLIQLAERKRHDKAVGRNSRSVHAPARPGAKRRPVGTSRNAVSPAEMARAYVGVPERVAGGASSPCSEDPPQRSSWERSP